MIWIISPLIFSPTAVAEGVLLGEPGFGNRFWSRCLGKRVWQGSGRGFREPGFGNQCFGLGIGCQGIWCLDMF